jgi:hypothetical protein
LAPLGPVRSTCGVTAEIFDFGGINPSVLATISGVVIIGDAEEGAIYALESSTGAVIILGPYMVLTTRLIL